MFDRLYRLMIRHEGLTDEKDNILVLDGDSSRPSLDISFSVKASQAGVSEGGTVSVSGLTTKHIEQLITIKRYDAIQAAEYKNALALEVAYRDLKSGVVSKFTKIAQGKIFDAMPGQFPERRMTFSLVTDMLYRPLDMDEPFIIEHDPRALPMTKREWISAAVNALNVKYRNASSGQSGGGSSGQGGVTTVKGITIKFNPCEVLDRLCDCDRFPTTVEDLIALCNKLGLTAVHVRNDSTGMIELTVGGISSDDNLVRGDIYAVSLADGMIGMPRSTENGAVVDVVLKNPVPPGAIVYLKSKTLGVALDSTSNKYGEKGVYKVINTTFSGNFHGDDWKQTLEMLRAMERWDDAK